MKGADNHLYITLLILSNVIAVLQLVAAIRWPRLSRLSFFLLFTWASWVNWKTALQTPQVYLEYGELAWSRLYKDFINGWFAENIQTAVGFVATSQALIAVSMLLKGPVFKLGCMGAIIFLLAILPLGVGAGFPSTGIMAIACFILARYRSTPLIWQQPVLSGR